MLSDKEIEFAFKKQQTAILIAYIIDAAGQVKFISTNTTWVHAEVACINKVMTWQRKKRMSAKKIARFWSQHSLVVLRYTSGMRKLVVSKPCKHCVNRIKKLPIKKVIFINRDCKLENVRTRDLKDDYLTAFDAKCAKAGLSIEEGHAHVRIYGRV